MPGEAILVTGGAGFIGSALCQALLRQGHSVVAFDDLSAGRPELLAPQAGCRLVQGDLRDATAVERLLGEVRPRRILHLAALHYIPHCNARPLDTVEINVAATRNLLGACRRLSLGSFFLASTAAVYPIAGSPFPEETPVGPIDIYGHSKAMAEDLARLFHRETRVPTVVGRFSNAFGPNETNPHLIPDVLAQLRAGGDTLALGNLDPVRDYIHVEDLVAGMLAAERTADAFSVVNIGSGRGLSVRQVVAAFESALGRPLRIVQAPDRLRSVDRQELVLDITKLKRSSGWRPKMDFAAGIAALLAGEGRP